MISIQMQNVPSYLRHSPYFLNIFQGLDDDDAEQAIDIPGDCFKHTPTVNSAGDLQSLLQTVRYWLIPEFVETSTEVFSFVLEHKSALMEVNPDFLQDFPFLEKLRTVVSSEDNAQILENAVKNGMLPLIKHLHRTGISSVESCTRFTSIAAEYGHTACLAYGLELGSRLMGDECTFAARRKDIQAFKLAAEYGCTVTATTFALVAAQDLVELVDYLHSEGVVWNECTTEAAIKHNSLRCLQYLMEHGCPLPEEACTLAARQGSLECLKLLHEEYNEPITRTAVNSAASAGHLPCLAYAYEKSGVNVDSSACIEAASSGHLDCLQYRTVKECL